MTNYFDEIVDFIVANGAAGQTTEIRNHHFSVATLNTTIHGNSFNRDWAVQYLRKELQMVEEDMMRRPLDLLKFRIKNVATNEERHYRMKWLAIGVQWTRVMQDVQYKLMIFAGQEADVKYEDVFETPVEAMTRLARETQKNHPFQYVVAECWRHATAGGEPVRIWHLGID